jgi:hypothetical protein
MDFFPADPPSDDELAFAPEPERTPWLEPPADELPASFAVSEVIGRGDDVVVALASARVFSDGVELLIERHLRRGSRDHRQWRAAQTEFSGHGSGGASGDDRLRWGMALDDGKRIFEDRSFGAPVTDPSDGHTLRVIRGGGGGGSSKYLMRESLWLWPLPPEGPLELVVQWPAFGIGESRVIVDGGQLRALAAAVKPLWG